MGNKLLLPKGHVLVVDDKPDNLRLLSTMLTEQGYKVRKAINGELALMGVEDDLPDLILLDINMPQMNGYEVCQRLKANERTCEIPVIFISALDQAWNKVEAFAIGGIDYVSKPFQCEEVIARVENQMKIRQLQKQLQEQNALLQQEIYIRHQAELALQKANAALQEANAKLERLAHIDGLTQIANRRSFDQYLRQQWQRLAEEKLPLSLVMCDIDCFKAYNDTYGHQAGDDCLQQVSQAINCAIAGTENLVARYGGEELAIILPNTDAAMSLRWAEQIRQVIQALARPHKSSTVGSYVTVSLGVASLLPNNSSQPTQLIAAADRALYQAKAQGRDRIMVSS